MTDHDDLLGRVALRAGERSPQLPLPIGVEEIAAAERQLGVELADLQRLYTEVANGDFGPEYLLFPLIGEGRTATTAYLAEYGSAENRERYGPSEHWPRGVLPILDWGCAMLAAVDCLSPGAPVLLFEPNAGPKDMADAWFEDSPSLADWLQAWLGGTGWWEEEVMLAEDFLGPQPWSDAGKRICADR